MQMKKFRTQNIQYVYNSEKKKTHQYIAKKILALAKW